MVTFRKASSLLQTPFLILEPAYQLPPSSFVRFVGRPSHQPRQEKRTFVTAEASLTPAARGHVTDPFNEGGVDETVDCTVELASPRAAAAAVANIGMRPDRHGGPHPSSIIPARRRRSRPRPIIIRYRVKKRRCYVRPVWLVVPEQNAAIMPSPDTRRSSFPHMASEVSEVDKIFHDARPPRCRPPSLRCLRVTKKAS